MRKNAFDRLENADEKELELITELTPEFSDEQFERILKMSKEKRDILRKAKESNNITINTNEGYTETVTGVETYERPIWMRPLAAAASVLLMFGLLAAGHSLLNRSHQPAPDISSPLSPASTQTSVTTQTSDVTGIITKTTDATGTATASGGASDSDKTSETTTQTTVTTVSSETAVTETAAQQEQNNSANSDNAGVSAPSQSADNGKSEEEKALLDTALRITNEYENIYTIRWAWLRINTNDRFKVTAPGLIDSNGNVVSDYSYEQEYFRVEAPYDTAEAVKNYMYTYCTREFFDEDFSDLDQYAEKISDTEYRLNNYTDFMPLYLVKNGALYLTPGQLGYNFAGWSDKPLELVSHDESRMTVKRKYINDFDHSDLCDVLFDFVKESDGNWKINEVR